MSYENELVRQPAVAGTFYPADASECAISAARFLRSGIVADSRGALKPARNWIGAIVPHAGWICSGAIAGEAVWRLAGRTNANASAGQQPDVVVIFGAIHTALPIFSAVLSSADAWAVPTGRIQVRGDLNAALANESRMFVVDDRFHEHEHAVEVELPLIQSAWPGASLLPIELPAIDAAADIGAQTARAIANAGLSAVFLASSDLTHYGPAYGLAPAGVGPQGLKWAKENDRRLLGLALGLDAAAIVPEVRQHKNACGGGAIAAMLGACLECGAASAELLRHANSVETLANVAPQPPVNAVGYAGLLVG